MHYLMMTIYAPLAAHGESGAGTVRSTWTRPGRSAALGLVAAALGLDMADHDANEALSSGLGFAVRTDATGSALSDYHTVTVGKGAPAKRAQTRRDELAGPTHPSIITHRHYRCDGLYTIAMWARDSARWALDDIASALQAPHWYLYAGRRSCPLALPLDPQIIEADNLMVAFAQRVAIPPDLAEHLPIRLDAHREIACDADAPGLVPTQQTRRRDLYARPRIFYERTELITYQEA